ncbi:MAG TPA: Yip1 family protein [Gammaproteobacteria bacterium]|jgi:hypothetical protein|nr:Yip1 family protein [Gammaproteobacteria bacterium]
MEIASENRRKDIVGRVKNILFQPRAEWGVIAEEPATPKSLYLNYIMLLAAIGPIASIIGNSVVGVTLPFVGGHYRVPLGNSIGYAVLAYVLTLVGAFVLALVIETLAPNFGGVKDRTQALKVVAYSWTPSWIVAVVQIFPGSILLGLLALAAGIYGLYLLYLGLPPVMKSPPERAVGYTAASVIAAIIIYLIIGWLAAMTISYPTLSALEH